MKIPKNKFQMTNKLQKPNFKENIFGFSIDINEVYHGFWILNF